jgi:hypothetical protein
MIEIILPYSKIKAELSERITYGQQIAIDAILTEKVQTNKDGQMTITGTGEWTRAKMKAVVKKLTDGGKELPVTDEVLDALDLEDGQALELEVEKVFARGKKN